MKLHVVLPDRILATTPRARTPVRRLTVRRGEVLTVDVTFSMDGRTGPLPAGSVVSLAAFARPGSRTPLVFATSPTVIGRGASTTYRFPAVSFALDYISAALAVQPVLLTFEVQVSLGYALLSTSPVTLEVTQSALTSGATPPEIPSVPTSPLYIREITSLVGGGATALDGVLTVGREGLLALVYVDGELQTWRLFPGTDAELPAAGVVRPDDFHATTNPQVWKRLL